MMKKSIAGAVFFGGIGLFGLLGVNPAWSQQTCPGPSPCTFLETVFVAPTLPGRPARATTLVSCYATFFGEPLGCGNVIHKVLGLKEPTNDLVNNGGHQHSPETHPLTAPPPNDQLVFQNTGLLFDPKLGVSTGPVFGTAVILHHMPEASGNIVTETLVRAPLGWRCFLNCFDSLHGRTLTTLDVGISGLVPLEAGPNCAPSPPNVPFIICRNLTGTHPQGSRGTPGTISRVRILAEAYKEAIGNKLSINDISLPAGGVFDLCDTFNPTDTCPAAPNGGHKEHRAGREVDINSKDAGDVATLCLLYRLDLHDALLESNVRSLVCHKGGASHVRF